MLIHTVVIKGIKIWYILRDCPTFHIITTTGRQGANVPLDGENVL